MSQAKAGDTVKIHYTGKLDDGTEFDSSAGRDPLEFTLGEKTILPTLETAVVGMTVGDKKEVRLEPDDAYGERTDERVIEVPKDQAPEGLEVGQQVLLGQAVEGMATGDTKSVRLEPDEAYGQRHDQLVQEVAKSALPDEIDPKEGMALQSRSPDGQVTQLVVTEVKDESIMVDANHPLAGHALSFDIELVEID